MTIDAHRVVGMQPALQKPLFDRFFVSEDLCGKQDDLDGVLASIKRELERLLNTRVSHPISVLKQTIDEGLYPPPSFYGIPDLSTYERESQDQWPILERLFQRTVAHYEPRLDGVRVKIKELSKNKQKLTLQVFGSVRLGLMTEDISLSFMV